MLSIGRAFGSGIGDGLENLGHAAVDVPVEIGSLVADIENDQLVIFTLGNLGYRGNLSHTMRLIASGRRGSEQFTKTGVLNACTLGGWSIGKPLVDYANGDISADQASKQLANVGFSFAASGEVTMGYQVFSGTPATTAAAEVDPAASDLAAANELAEAEAARDALAQQMGRKSATYTGGVKDGRVVAGRSKNPAGCAEDDVARQLGPDARFTKAMGWRRNQDTGELELVEIEVCHNCQAKYSPNQFPPDVKSKPGGPWEQR